MAECLESDNVEDERELGLVHSAVDFGDYVYQHYHEAHGYTTQFAAGFITGRGWMLYDATDNEIIEESRGYIDGMVARVVEPDTPVRVHLERLDIPEGVLVQHDFDKHVADAPMCNALIDEFTAELTASVDPFIRDALDLYNEHAFALGDMSDDRYSLASGTYDTHKIRSPLTYMVLRMQSDCVGVFHTPRGMITQATRDAHPDYPWDRYVFEEYKWEVPPRVIDESAAIARRAEIVAVYASMRRTGMVAPLVHYVLAFVFGTIPVAAARKFVG